MPSSLRSRLVRHGELGDAPTLPSLRAPAVSPDAGAADSSPYRHHPRRQSATWRAHGIRDPRDIYALGARKLDDVLNWCSELGVAAVTLWVFSTENLERPIDQVSGILSAIEAKVRALAHDPQIHTRRVRVRAIGKLELLPGPIIAAIRAAREATAAYDGMTLTIAVALWRSPGDRRCRSLLVSGSGETRAHISGRHQRDHAIGDRKSSLYGGSAGSRFDHQNQRRDPAVGLSAAAERP